MSPIAKKLILVLGATGAQGMAVIDGLLAPSSDGSPSPYVVRALTRDPNHRRAQELAAKGVHLYKGSGIDLKAIQEALEGAYGVWVNTDSHALGEQAEVFLGMRIFEVAKQTPTLRHYVYSNLEYAFKKGGYDSQYRCEHYDGKGRVADWMKAQPFATSDDNMSWSILTTAAYMEMLNFMFAPFTRRADGTYVFAAPIGDGHVPMITFSDFGYFVRYTFDNRASTSGKNLEVASDMVGWDYLVETFQKVTGKKAVAVKQTTDQWMRCFKSVDGPVSHGAAPGLTFRESFSGWWAIYRDDLLTRDMDWVRKIHPRVGTLESWMREAGYTGDRPEFALLKDAEDSDNAFALDFEYIESSLSKA